uniref:HTH psq-type domain-containing protein n=1 Tax=Surirella sp. TaxID=1526603 RepID=A0A2R4A3K7_9STRA|nr:hypothetical protein [Surirella sp.]
MFLICRCILFILVLKYFLREMVYDLDKKLEVLAFYDEAMAEPGALTNKVKLAAETFDIPRRTIHRWIAQRQEFPGQKCLIQKFWLKIKVKHVQFVLDYLLKTNEITSSYLLPDKTVDIKVNFSRITADLNIEFKTNFCTKSVKSIIARIFSCKKEVLEQFDNKCDEETFRSCFNSCVVSKCEDYD